MMRNVALVRTKTKGGSKGPAVNRSMRPGPLEVLGGNEITKRCQFIPRYRPSSVRFSTIQQPALGQ